MDTISASSSTNRGFLDYIILLVFICFVISSLLFALISFREWYSHRNNSKREEDSTNLTADRNHSPVNSSKQATHRSNNTKSKPQWYRDDLETRSVSLDSPEAMLISLESKLIRLEKQLQEINQFLILSTVDIIVRNKPIFDEEKLKILRWKAKLSQTSSIDKNFQNDLLANTTEFADWNHIASECNKLIQQISVKSSMLPPQKKVTTSAQCIPIKYIPSKRLVKVLIVGSMVMMMILFGMRAAFSVIHKIEDSTTVDDDNDDKQSIGVIQTPNLRNGGSTITTPDKVKDTPVTPKHSLAVFENLLPGKRPWAMYSADMYDPNTNKLIEWFGETSKNADIQGEVIINKREEHDDESPYIDSITGGMDTRVLWPATRGLFDKPITICAITRYANFHGRSSQLRILTVDGSNWLLGHWGGKRGIAYSEGWYNEIPQGKQYDWLSMCFTNEPLRGKYSLMIDNIPMGNPQPNGIKIAANTVLTINGQRWHDERSDWAFSKLLIWDHALESDEIQKVSTTLQSILTTGTTIGSTNTGGVSLKDIVIVTGTSERVNGRQVDSGIYIVEGSNSAPMILASVPNTFAILYIDLLTQKVLFNRIIGETSLNDVETALTENISTLTNNPYLMIFQANGVGLTKSIMKHLAQCGGTRRKLKDKGFHYVMIGKCRQGEHNSKNTFDIRPETGESEVIRLQLVDGKYHVTI